ncbi:M48 family metallopeptidase [Caldibacillus lycopersici]|uniref:M48 family metallopeptidase n=1 Tax=Perspicuibacillus lycopersici TaxID=1325689 RepID=A0AAE3IQE1_9BACI|nr:M48 family metallopeptidase [Perspicuibacillus lycopersici]MCU9612487.1 M48 family metallopeptidase [Perspicuibacillus lycopersici]
MKKKIAITGVSLYILFCGFIYLYLFVFQDATLPANLVGTSIDPATFLSREELLLSEQYSKIRDLLFFLEIPYEWLFYLFILLFGLGKVFYRWANEYGKLELLKSAIFTFCLSLLSFVCFFPFRYIRYTLSKNYGISTQDFSSWMRDGMIDFWINWLMLFFVVAVLYWLLRKSPKRWWIYAWLLTIPFTIFYMYIQPVVIDPLYNDFYPIQNKALENKILDLAGTAGIPAEHVYEVNMSEKTNALNAYVTGIGANARIVLWDTTLNRLADNEILFIMAHEMAHYVEKHIYIGMVGYLLLLFVCLFVVGKLLNLAIKKYGEIFAIDSVQSLSSLPLLLLIVSMLLFATSPLTNAVSRYQEMRADRYAIELTQDVEAGVETFQELTKTGLSQVDPPALVKWFRYGHPTMKERILLIEQYENTTDNK